MKHFFYRCNIELDYPLDTRILLIEANSSLSTVHDIIQLAFELDNNRDFQFYHGKIPYIPVGFTKANIPRNFTPLASKLPLSALELKSNTVLSYLYDFQNPFLFHITIEKLCSADTTSTSPRLLQNPEEIHSPVIQNFKDLFKNEFL